MSGRPKSGHSLRRRRQLLAGAAFCLALAVAPALSQTIPLGPRFVLPYQTVIDMTGVPLPGAQLFFYASGTNTPLSTYSDPLLTVPNTEPVVANAAGVFPNIFLLESSYYKVVLTDSLGNQVWTADPVPGLSGSGSSDTVNVTNPAYGAIAGNPSAYVTNQTAFNAALATGQPVYCPPGDFYTQAITIPTNAAGLFGPCTLIAAGTFGSPNAVLYGTGTTNLKLQDFTVSVNLTSYPTLNGIDLFNTVSANTGQLVDNVKVDGFDAINDIGSTNATYRYNTITNFKNIGIVATGGYNFLIDHNNVTTSLTGTYYDIQFINGAQATISNNSVSNGGDFGIEVTGLNSSPYTPSHSIVVSNNRVLNTVAEGINFTNVELWTMTGNEVEWNNGSSTDFGISVWGNPALSPNGVAYLGTISANHVYFSCKAGIALDDYASYINVTGNGIYGANNCNGSDAFHTAAILMYGPSVHNGVSANNIVDPSAHLTWDVNEYNDGNGSPNYNHIGQNTGDVGSSGSVNIIGSNSTYGDPCPFTIGASSCSGSLSVASSIPVWATTGVGGSGVTQYFTNGLQSATETTVAIPHSGNGILSNSHFVIGTAPGGSATDTLTIDVANTATPISCVITGSATSCADATHTAPISTGQTYDVKIVGSTGAAATLVVGSIGFSP